jgi:hypothetical protein
MKKSLLFITALSVVTMLIACGKTELSWTNASATGINDIVWESGDQTWNTTTTGGFASSTTTDSKEVDATKGEITQISLYNGSGYDAATAKNASSGDTSFVLSEGESNNYSIVVTKN